MRAVRYIKRNTDAYTMIFLFILSILIAGIFKDLVNGFVTYVLLPKERVEVTLSDRADIIVKTDNVSAQTEEAIFGAPDRRVNWRRDAHGNYVVDFELIKSPTWYIYVPLTETLTEMIYNIGEKLSVIRQFTETEMENGFARVYPFEASYLKVVLQLLIYVVLTSLIWLGILLCHIHLKTGKIHFGILSREYKNERLWFFGIWVLLYLIALTEYHIGLPNYMPDNAVGDQAGYWATYIFKDGSFDFDLLASLATFRGYLSYIFSSAARFLGHHSGIDPVSIYLLCPAFFFSWLTTIILPKLYLYLTGKKALFGSVISSVIVISFYWNEYLTLDMMDFYGITALFAAFAYTMEAIKRKKILAAGIAGFCFGFSINLRVAYYYAVLVMITGFLFYDVYGKIKNRKLAFKEIFTLYKKKIIMAIKYVIVGLMGFLIISVPQGITNYRAGHIGLLPHDSEFAYVGRPVTLAQWNTFLQAGMVLWPRFISDDQLATMKTQLYADRGQILEVPQAMDVYANSPIETVVCMVKKIVTGLDRKSNIGYPESIDWRGSSGLAFSFWNYLILSIGLYIFFRHEGVAKKEKIFIILFLSGAIIPMLGMHCEWRYFISGYMILYFLFLYHYIGEILIDNQQYVSFCEYKFFRFIVIAEIFAFILSLTLWA